MFKETRQGWLVVGALFVSLFFVWGAANAGPVFFVPLLKEFGWSRERLSTLFGASALATGASGPFIGWLLDRIEARIVMVTGSVICGAAFLLASRVHSFGLMPSAYAVLGAGIGTATVLHAGSASAGRSAASAGSSGR